MQKVLDILEKYVEWLALALGVAFFGWMSWAYLITSPVAKMVGGQELTPANVDQYVSDNKTQRLIDLMGSATPPTFTIPDFGQYVPDSLGFKSAQPVTEIASIWDFEPSQVTTASDSNGTSAGPIISQLPVLPPATPLAVMSGQSTIVTPDASASATATPPATPSSNHKDIHWATIIFSIPSGPLKDQWTKAFGPDKPNGQWKLSDVQRQTRFLSLEAYRSEKLPDGSWSDPVLVPRLGINDIQPYPSKTSKPDEMRYDGWAANNATNILTPKFYDLAPPPSGKFWKDPSVVLTELISPTAVTPAPGQSTPPASTPPAAGAADNGDDTTGTTPGSPSTPGQAPVVAIPNFYDPDVVPASPLPTTVPVPLNGGANATTGVTSGTFNPAPAPVAATPGVAPAAVPDILVYLHDDTVVPGHTYRYVVVYKLRNPLFNMPPQRAKDKSWTDLLDLTSLASAPTPEVTIAPQTYFYCADGGNRGVKGFSFEVFTWAAGLWQKHLFTVFPGDEIGGLADGINYATGFTFVDGRPRSQQFLVTVVDDTTGQTAIRRADVDASGNDHKLRQQWVDQAKIAPPTPGAGEMTSNSSSTTEPQ